MDQQNIDRLFREKLGMMEEAPSHAAWSAVEKQIGRKKTPVYYWVAASVTLLMISWIVWPSSQVQDFTPIAGEVSHPVYTAQPSLELPEIQKNIVKEVPQKKVRKVPVQIQLASSEPIEEKVHTIESFDEELIDAKTTVAQIEIEEPVILNEKIDVKKVMEESAFQTVRITYIASANSEKTKLEQTQKPDSTTTLKKFIAFAEKIDPADVLSEFKEAKDNLLSGGLRGKKERNSL